MPELPEVETIVRGLRATLPGRRILQVHLGKTDFIDEPAALEASLPGSKIVSVKRHGKFIVLDIEPSNEMAQNFSLLVHLGMTGRLVVCSPNVPIAPHTHVFFELDDGRELRYTDPRRFGSIQMLQESARADLLGKLGADPLETTVANFIAVLRNRRARIKALLLDQRVLRGMGNIYTDESLWRARIHPTRIGAELQDAELRRLFRVVQLVLNEAIRLGGSSISDYVNSEGKPGEYQFRHRVYQREGKSCYRCGASIRRVIVAGRSSYFCPRCQRGPRKKAPQ
jgi:formamidopyrimidine-DNA glycosylase